MARPGMWVTGVEHRSIAWLLVAWAFASGLSACATSADDQPPGTYTPIDPPDGSAGSTSSVAGQPGLAGSSNGLAGAGGTAGGVPPGGSGGSSGQAGAAGASSLGSAGEAGSAGAAGSSGASGAAGAAGGGPDGGGDGGGPCVANTLEERSCGMCGTQARVCDATGAWLPWGACTGEVGECVPGVEVLEPCELCGQRRRFCSSTCDWIPGPCENQGVCEPGTVRVTTASCPADHVRTSTCTDQCQDGSWSPCAEKGWSTLPQSPLSARRYHAADWSGQHIVIAGGYGSSPSYKDDVALYTPSTKVWSSLAPWPSGMGGRYWTATHHTGGGVIVWGGRGSSPTYKEDGARFSFSSGTWSMMSTTNAPSGRYGFAHAWDSTGQRFLVWGGAGSSPTYKSDGFAYDLATDQWSALPAAPITGRRQMAYAWDDARRVLYVWGGYAGSSASMPADGAAYDAASNTWRTLPPAPGLAARRYLPGVVASGRFIVWGGYGGSSPLDDGAMYDPDTDSWTTMASAPIPGRRYHLAVTDGARVFVFGGRDSSDELGDGAIFDPVANSWIAVALDGDAPEKRYGLGGAWTPEGIVVWGGRGDATYLSDGALYKP